MRDVIEKFSPRLFSASGQIPGIVKASGGGTLGGIFVSASTNGTITIYDTDTATAVNKIVDTFSVLPGTYYPLPFTLVNGLYIVVGGVLSATAGIASV